jgi:hypothetical protein
MSKSFFVRAAALCLLAGCASGGSQAGNGTTTDPASSSSGASRIDSPWPIKTRSHFDLWLHGFAMIQDDTTRVPYFKRGYRDQMVVERNRANITTMLDANRDKLRARFAINRNLVNAQFLAFQFGTWDQMQQFIGFFIDAEGDPRRGNTAETQQAIAVLAQSFPTAADRDWLRLFAQSLNDENNRFYRAWWTQQQRDRTPVLQAVDSLFEKIYRPRFTRYLNNTQQARGEFFLSLPLDGEGRSVSGGKNQNIVTTSFPERPANALEAIYVFAHEVIGSLANQAVADNITPSEQRSGALDRLSSASLVRGGAMLLAKVAPELSDGYARYYLRSANMAVGSDPQASLAAAFPLPETIRDAISRQLDVVLGGI